MNISSLKKITIVAERVLREQILEVLQSEGATGHTLTAVEGTGSRGIHATDFEGRNVQIESIVSPRVAENVLNRIAAKYLENFAVIAYVSDVDVLRRGKFASEDQAEASD